MIIIESIVLCVLFTIMVYVMSRDPIKILFDYPTKIQERIKTIDEYKDKIPTKKDKSLTKIIASIAFMIVFCLILRYINGYTTFIDGFKYGFLLWTVVNMYDLVVLDILWFCHSKHFVLKGTEDMIDEYHNYWFHFKGFLEGEVLAGFVCTIVGLIIQFIL